MKIHLHLFTSAEKARTWFGGAVVTEKWVYDRRQRIVFDSNRDAHYGFVAANASELKRLQRMSVHHVHYASDLSPEVTAEAHRLFESAEHTWDMP